MTGNRATLGCHGAPRRRGGKCSATTWQAWPRRTLRASVKRRNQRSPRAGIPPPQHGACGLLVRALGVQSNGASARPGAPLSWQPQPPPILLSSQLHDREAAAPHTNPGPAPASPELSPVQSPNGCCPTMRAAQAAIPAGELLTHDTSTCIAVCHRWFILRYSSPPIFRGE